MNPPSPMDPESAASYVQHLTGCQNQLYAYIYSLLGNAEIALDVLQETNVVLWSKAAEYDPARPFVAWALGVAFHQVRAARTRLGRDRLVFHNLNTLETLTDDWLADTPSNLEIALDDCLNQLSPKNQQIVERYYKQSESLSSIGKALNRTANAVGVMLHRIRKKLAQCIEAALGPLGGNPSEI